MKVQNFCSAFLYDANRLKPCSWFVAVLLVLILFTNWHLPYYINKNSTRGMHTKCVFNILTFLALVTNKEKIKGSS